MPQDHTRFGWLQALARLTVTTAGGLLLGAGYGLLVGGVHLATSGRWGNGLDFAFWAACSGAGLGLLVGIGLTLGHRRLRKTGPVALSSNLTPTLLRTPVANGAFSRSNPGWRS